MKEIILLLCLFSSIVLAEEDQTEYIVNKIDHALSRTPTVSEYLYDTNNPVQATAATLSEIYGDVFKNKTQREIYDQLYQVSSEYAALTSINLTRAKTAADSGNSETAQRYLNQALRYEQQFFLADKAAIDAYLGNVDTLKVATKELYEGFQLVTELGVAVTMGPVAAQSVDKMFDYLQFFVDSSSDGTTEATKNFVINQLASGALEHASFDALGGNSIKEYLSTSVTHSLGQSEMFNILAEVVDNPGSAARIMKLLGRSSDQTIKKLTQSQLEKLLHSMKDNLINQQKLQQVTNDNVNKVTNKPFVSMPANAVDEFSFIPDKDYCGPEGKNLKAIASFLIPDGIFRAKCYNHDKCYKNEGDRLVKTIVNVFNKPNNQDTISQIVTTSEYSFDTLKKQCDDQFYSDLQITCNKMNYRKVRRGGELKQACDNAASTYYKAVTSTDFFSGAVKKTLRELESKYKVKYNNKYEYKPYKYEYKEYKLYNWSPYKCSRTLYRVKDSKTHTETFKVKCGPPYVYQISSLDGSIKCYTHRNYKANEVSCYTNQIKE